MISSRLISVLLAGFVSRASAASLQDMDLTQLEMICQSHVTVVENTNPPQDVEWASGYENCAQIERDYANGPGKIAAQSRADSEGKALGAIQSYGHK